MTPTPDYNKVFETLVADEYDLEGIIAYGLYKQEKRKQIVDIKDKNGKNPTPKQYEFIESVLTKHLEFYKEKANQTLNGTFEFFIENQKEELYEKYFKNHEQSILNEKLNRIEDNTKNSNLGNRLNIIDTNTKPKNIWSELKIEVLGNVVWTVILIIISIIVYFNSGGVKLIKSKLVEVIQEAKADSTSAK